MQIVTVTIGRNVGDKPMSRKEWAEFIEDIEGALTWIPYGGVLQTFKGRGEWHGVGEDSAHITYRLNRPISEWALSRVRGMLSRIGTDHHQDAVAFSLGDSDLIYS